MELFILLSALLSLLRFSIATNSTILNPMLPGFHPDPACIFVPDYDNTFFCASSSFEAFPGLPIHASKDLIHWKLVSNALNRGSQLPTLAITNKSTSGIWGPALRYHEGTFYLLTTLVFDDQPETNFSRWDNLILKTTNPYSSAAWSDPVHFNFTGYDTSPFWDIDGTVYVTGSHPWEIQPGINQATIDLDTGEVGPIVNVWNGTGGEAPEGPKLFLKDGWYYLMIAEGGTGLNHEEDIARSKNINGPYESNPANPILTNANTSAYFQTVGHADLFQDATAQWWGVALSTRSGPNFTVYPMGRETVLTAVTWEAGDWPIFTNVSGRETAWPLPPTQLVTQGEGPLITAPDNVQFEPGSNIPPQFLFWRIPIMENYVISPPGHPNTLQLTSSVLNLTGYDGNYAGPEGQTFLGRRQVDTLFTYSVDLSFTPENLEDEAGISVFLVQNHHFDLGVVMLANASSSNSSALAPYFRFRGISYLPTPEPAIIPVPESWLGEKLRMEIKAFNLTHYAMSAGPAEHVSEMVTVGYAPGADLSFGFTGELCGY